LEAPYTFNDISITIKKKKENKVLNPGV